MAFWRFLQPAALAGLLIAALAATGLADDGTRPDRDSGAAGNWLRKLQRFRASANERDHPLVKEAFREVIRDARQSTVRVLCDDLQVALGAIVDPRGYVLTKHSELQGEITCLLADGRRVPAEVVAQRPDYDLALLKVTAGNLTALRWSESSPAVGAWLATTGLSVDPKAIGVLSTPERDIPAPRAVLGVHLDESSDGPRIRTILPDSAAAQARLQVGDIILDVNGQTMTSPQSVSETISQYRPGDQVVLLVRRGTRSISVTTTLSDLMRLVNEQAEIMDSLGGPLSRRRNGFPTALQHDTVLLPRDCGGPLVDLTGKVVGINIARASRVASYAIPGHLVQSLLPSMMPGGLAETATAATDPQVGSD